MSTHTYKKFEESSSGSLPDKMTVYQDCLNEFNESPINPKRCRMLIARLLKLILHGEIFPSGEATSLFFSISKLFQHPNNSLRQAVYVAIKELSTISDDTLMITSSIMKDVQNGSDLVKPNAIRALARVLEDSTAYSAERLYKSAVISKDLSISSAALVSSYHLLPSAESTVKRYSNEIQEAVFDLKNPAQYGITDFHRVSSYISQYHALGLMYKLKSHDKVATMKMIQQFSSGDVLRSPLAQVQMVRMVHELLSLDTQLVPHFVPLLSNWLSSRHEYVQLEVCKLVTALNSSMPTDIFVNMIQTLKGFLTVSRVCSRFAAVRILNKISMVSPDRIVICNPELESLIEDSNRIISTYAITTLLKTATSKNISSFIKTITKFIQDVSDDFNIIIIDSVRALSLKFPEEWKNILTFLIETLKNSDGGYDFKNIIVEALIDLVKYVPQSKELVLENMCDFIEDCEYNELLMRILYLLGKEGPSSKNPSLFVRHNYNRVVLENSVIRSAAVSSLSKFALIKGDPILLQSIESLLRGIKTDEDDEVRDRAAISLKFIEHFKEDEIISSKFIQLKQTYDLQALESKLTQYLYFNEDNFETAFETTNIPRYTDDELKAMELKQKQETMFSITEQFEKPSPNLAGDLKSTKVNGSVSSNDMGEKQLANYSEELEKIPEFASFGRILNSSKPIPMTDSEAEFKISGVKHLFEKHVILQFDIINTLNDVVLDDVVVVSSPEDESNALEQEFVISIDRLLPHETKSCYISFKKPKHVFTYGFLNKLTFTTLELNQVTNEPFQDDEGFHDEYEIDSFYLHAGDYIKSFFVSDFDQTFKKLPYEEIAVYNLSESSSSLQNLVNTLILTTNCLPLENTQFVPSEANTHTLKLFGERIVSDAKVALVVKIVKSNKTTALKIQCKSEDESLSVELANGLVL